ncbi:hypothetical protein L204_104420 [Cryptococcus depauperatus]|nr:hypothetical protein L204_06411 [Cryptococcus depauperatus CBS 7855]
MPFNEDLDRSEFRIWLGKTIEPLCDADPAVLSDYIVALLKHEASMDEGEWKSFITRELVDFLESSSGPFVETLFQTLSTKSFMIPEAAQSVVRPMTQPPPQAPKAQQLSHTIPTEPAAVVPAYNPRQPSLQSVKNEDVNMQESQTMQNARPLGKPKCRNYHERGFCMRGVNCQYEHSDDMLIPTPDMLFGGFLPPFMGMPGFPAMSDTSSPRGIREGRGRRRGDHGGRYVQDNHGAEREQFQGTSRPPPNSQSTTILVTDIPHQHLSVPIIQDYFSKFGNVTSVATESRGKRALVSFDTNLEAYKAWKSDEAIFGNRHIKVLWHRPREGQGAAGQKALEQNKVLVENLQKLQSGDTLSLNHGVKAKLSGPETRLQATLATLEHRERQSRIEPLMAEQKVLLKKASAGSKEEKIAILKRLREITKELGGVNKSPQKTEEMEVEDDEKTKLDRELAAHGMEREKDDELDKLNKQLASLKEKANTLGINPSPRYQPYPSRGGARGRGNRGRGGHASYPPRFKLDNRSRTIIITGERFDDQIAKQAANNWFVGLGGKAEEAPEGTLKVTYPTREMAEKALAAGTKEIKETSGPLKITWETQQFEPRVSGLDVQMGVDTEIGLGEEERRGDRDDE